MGTMQARRFEELGLVQGPPADVEISTLSRDVAEDNGRSAHLVELVNLRTYAGRDVDDHKLRLRIKADVVPTHALAVVERWNGGEWCELWKLTPALMQTPQVQPGQTLQAEWFEADRRQLLNRAADTLARL